MAAQHGRMSRGVGVGRRCARGMGQGQMCVRRKIRAIRRWRGWRDLANRLGLWPDTRVRATLGERQSNRYARVSGVLSNLGQGRTVSDQHVPSPEPGPTPRTGGAPAGNTVRAYELAWRQFCAWCAEGAVPGGALPSGSARERWVRRIALPGDADVLADYVRTLIHAERSVATIEQAIAAIRARHWSEGFKNAPETWAARQLLRDYRAERVRGGRGPRKTRPITLDQLRLVLGACDPQTLIGKRDRVMLTLGFALYGRRSELSALELDDVERTAQGLVVVVRRTMADGGIQAHVVPIRAGRDRLTDPVAAVVSWRIALADIGVTQGRLLRAVTRHDTLYRYAAMTGQAINERVRVLGLRAGVPGAERLTSHGLRAGAATTAAKRGAAVTSIAEQGRWCIDSPVVYQYVRDSHRLTEYPDLGL